MLKIFNLYLEWYFPALNQLHNIILQHISYMNLFFLKNINLEEFPSGPVDKTLSFHCQGCQFDPWSRN